MIRRTVNYQQKVQLQLIAWVHYLEKQDSGALQEKDAVLFENAENKHRDGRETRIFNVARLVNVIVSWMLSSIVLKLL